MPYYEDIYGCDSIKDIIIYCHNALPDRYKDKPWTHDSLKHGHGILRDEEALNCYMAAYGEMHVAKCIAAMQTFPFNSIQGNIEIVDWGCGQGIGAAAIIEELKKSDLLGSLLKVTLIDPSKEAIERAKYNIITLTQNTVEIDVKNLFLPVNDSIDIENINSEIETLNSIEYTHNNVIHVFSNILDVTTIDLKKLANMVKSTNTKQFILCIGPKNDKAKRIGEFCSLFTDIDYFSQIDNEHFAFIERNKYQYSCITRCFEYNGATIDLLK